MQLTSPVLENLFLALPSVRTQHEPGSPLYQLLKLVAQREVLGLFSEDTTEARDFPPFGSLVFPYFKMGAIDSLHLFGLDELIIFSFYWSNRARYRRTLDIGANIGLHSIMMSRCGYEVRAYEPDPTHFKLLQRNLALNQCTSVRPINAAVSSKPGTMEFVRVLGNTTGSHLAGAKSEPYGELERFPVTVEAIEALWPETDLIKLDAEGHEKEILGATHAEHWQKTDAMIEVGSAANAEFLYHHFNGLKVNLFAQKINWEPVRNLAAMPTSHRDGSLFITRKNQMPWDV